MEDPGLSRRSFVQLLGAGIALAGLEGCFSRPREKILPYVAMPELTPGLAQHYATSMVLGGYGTGLLVESNAGRPTKIEGNPDHPASLGAAGVFEQASVLQLYDPHRARKGRQGSADVSWDAFAGSVAPAALKRLVGAGGTGLRFLLEPTGSPLTASLLDQLRELYPKAGIHFYAPFSSREIESAALQTFGRALQPVYDFSQADVVLSLDADFLDHGPFRLRYAHDFSERRRIAGPSDTMNRLYLVEAAFSPTGSLADHRLRSPARSVAGIAARLLSRLDTAHGMAADGIPPSLRSQWGGIPLEDEAQRWTDAVAADLAAHRGRSVVIAGEQQPMIVHLLAHLANNALGNWGRTVRSIESPLLSAGDNGSSLAALVDAMQSGEVETLVMLEGNPSYNAPADFEFSRRLREVPHSIYLGLYENETATDARTFIPALHYLEAWGDARAYDGTASLVQPLISPLYGGRTPADVLAAFLGSGATTVHDRLRRHWEGHARGDFDQFWDQALQRGVIPETEARTVNPALSWANIARELSSLSQARPAPRGLELVFVPDPKVHDGAFCNNTWLQELPHPITKLTWDNAAMLSPATASRIGVRSGEMLELWVGSRSLRAPALIVPGHADNSISLSGGYGRRAEGEPVARGVGANGYLLWSTGPYQAPDLQAKPVLEGGSPVQHALAITQTHWAMEGRPLALQATLAEYRQDPGFTRSERGRPLSLYQPEKYTGDQWAMVIDQSLCTGCGACVVACQAENNVPVVGKEGVLNSREMHWLRIDRYLSGPENSPEIVSQPMLCQHCEKAPCEYVCPVSATKHSPDGLNEMVYNRCVGTRFCSNNCPYKVRRFNWFNYNAELAEPEEMVKNPDVTVRARGVMEKCTFCVQRIRAAEINAQIEGRPIRDGDFTTACAQACPTRAITFGSKTDPKAEVTRRTQEPREYAVLNELGTEPRVRYLARITNPAPGIEPGS